MSLLFAAHVLGKLFSAKILRKWYGLVSQIGDGEKTKEVYCTNTNYKDLKKYPADT